MASLSGEHVGFQHTATGLMKLLCSWTCASAQAVVFGKHRIKNRIYIGLVGKKDGIRCCSQHGRMWMYFMKIEWNVLG